MVRIALVATDATENVCILDDWRLGKVPPERIAVMALGFDPPQVMDSGGPHLCYHTMSREQLSPGIADIPN